MLLDSTVLEKTCLERSKFHGYSSLKLVKAGDSNVQHNIVSLYLTLCKFLLEHLSRCITVYLSRTSLHVAPQTPALTAAKNMVIAREQKI